MLASFLTRLLRRGALWAAAVALLLTAVACGGAPAATPTAAPPPPTTAPATPADPSSTVRTFAIDPSASEAAYIVDEQFFEDALSKLGINPGPAVVTGRTRAISGQLALDLADLPASPLGSFRVDMTTLQTDQPSRDRWIRENGPNFNRYPTAEFIAASAAGLPATAPLGQEVMFTLSGDLTIREVTRPVTFNVTARLDGDVLTGVARADLLMSDFGIEPPSFLRTLTVADPFKLEITLTARAQ